VTGRVVSNEPLAVALVEASGELVPLQSGVGTNELTPVLETSASGAFRLRDVPVGSYRLRVGRAAELRSGGFRREFEVELTPAMDELELRP